MNKGFQFRFGSSKNQRNPSNEKCTICKKVSSTTILKFHPITDKQQMMCTPCFDVLWRKANKTYRG